MKLLLPLLQLFLISAGCLAEDLGNDYIVALGDSFVFRLPECGHEDQRLNNRATTWYKYGKELIVSGNEHYDVLDYDHDSHKHGLRINNIEAEDEGWYRCGYKFAGVYIQVIHDDEPPTIVDSSNITTSVLNTTVDDPVQLTCQFSYFEKNRWGQLTLQWEDDTGMVLPAHLEQNWDGTYINDVLVKMSLKLDLPAPTEYDGRELTCRVIYKNATQYWHSSGRLSTKILLDVDNSTEAETIIPTFIKEIIPKIESPDGSIPKIESSNSIKPNIFLIVAMSVLCCCSMLKVLAGCIAYRKHRKFTSTERLLEEKLPGMNDAPSVIYYP